MEQRLNSLKSQMETLIQALEQSKQIPTDTEQSIWKVATSLASLHTQVEQARQSYRMYERGTNVLEMADQEERKHQQLLDHQMKLQMVKTMPATAALAAPAPGGSLFGSAPAPGGSLFGSAHAP
eukprot:2382792-Ditylum_brightwellii.AAC.1